MHPHRKPAATRYVLPKDCSPRKATPDLHAGSDNDGLSGMLPVYSVSDIPGSYRRGTHTHSIETTVDNFYLLKSSSFPFFCKH